MEFVCPKCQTTGSVEADKLDSLTCPACGFSVTTRSVDAAGIPRAVGLNAETEVFRVPRQADHLATAGQAFVPEPGMWLANRYEVTRYIAGGGFGHVVEAFDKKLRRRVAIKVPRRDKFFSEGEFKRFYERFAAEGLKAAQFSHDGIVQVYDVDLDQESGWAYIVMELMEGGTLQQRFESQRPTLSESIAIVIEVAQAIDAAHKQDLFHRDLTPRNIFFTAQGKPKVGDFGLALRDEEQDDQTSEIAGTLSFMSPEQLNGERLDGRTDIWSLGVVLYWLLSGRLPFSGRKHVPRSAAASFRPRPLRQLIDVPRTLDDIVRKCIAWKPEDRYGAGQDLADALRGFLENNRALPAAAAPITSTPRWTRWVVAALAAVTVGVGVGVGVNSGLSVGAFARSNGGSQSQAANGVAAPVTGEGSGTDLARADVVADSIETFSAPDEWFDLFRREPVVVDWSRGVATDRHFFDAPKKLLHLNNGPQMGMLALGATQSRNFQIQVGIKKSARAGQCGVFFGSTDRQDTATGHRKHSFQFVGVKHVPTEHGAEARLTRALMTITTKDNGRYETMTRSITVPDEVLLQPEDPSELLLEITVQHGAVTRILAGTGVYPLLSDANLQANAPLPPCQGRLGVYNMQGASDVLRATVRVLTE